MTFDMIWLLISTFRIIRMIRRYSEQRHFIKELRNLAIVYWSFIACYLLWQAYYILDLKMDKQYEKIGYWHQILVLAFPFITFSQLPIALLFMVHFTSYTSLKSLFCCRLCCSISKGKKSSSTQNAQERGGDENTAEVVPPEEDCCSPMNPAASWRSFANSNPLLHSHYNYPLNL